MMVKERKNNFARIFNRRIFTTTTLSIVLLLIGIWNGLVSVPPGTSNSANRVDYSAPAPITTRSTPLSHAQQDAIAAESVAQKYMNALLKQNYQQMWSLLHPKMQAKWPNERTFAGFWKARYQDYILYAFTIGQIQPLPDWVDPETMVQYNQVEELRVSLELQPRLPSALLPPEDLHPIQVMRNLPFVVQHITGQSGDAWLVLDGGPADLEAPILPPARPVHKSIAVPILMYHHITDVIPPPSLALWSLTIERFSQQMDYLAAHGYHTVTFNQLMNALYYGDLLPSKPILLTFDDGDEDAYQNAYPILLKHHFSAMFYIVSGWVGLQGYMAWPQLREMLAHGMQMGSHTVDHPNLSYTLLYSLDQAQQELQEAQQVLQKNLGIVIQHFCYPYGEPFYRGGVIQRRQVMTFLPADGYVDATVAVGVVSGIIQMAQQPFMLPRVPVFGYESIWQFARSLPW
jgi:peptidoglycan/xylan/chitin deacetylase (PgdA/CDA1 family)